MAISIIAAAGTGIPVSTARSVNFSAYTPQADDLVVIWASSGSSSYTMGSISSDWTNVLGGTVTAVDSAHKMICVYHWVTNTDVGENRTGYTISNAWSGANAGSAAGIILRGVDRTAPVDAYSITNDNTASTTGVLPGLVGADLSTGSIVLSGISPGGTSTFTTPSGWTYGSSANSTSAVCTGSYDTLTTAGNDVADTSITMGSSRVYCSITVAFNAASSIPTSFGEQFLMMSQPPASPDDITGLSSIPFVTRNSSTGNLEVDGVRYRGAGANVQGSFGLSESVSGANIYGGTNVNGLHLATHAEIDATIATVKRLNANMIRSWAALTINSPLSVMPTLGNYSDANLEPLDYALWQCGKRGIRLILPLVDNYKYYVGGKFTWCTMSGVSPDFDATQFFTNATIKANFKAFISFVLNHRNRYTGIQYKNDPSILCWETGNELWNGSNWNSTCTAWTEEIASHIKVTEGAQQLVMDGCYGIYSDGSYTVNTAALLNPHVDIYSTHGNGQYREPKEVVYQAGVAKAYGKAFIMGEYCWTGKTVVSAGGNALPWTLIEMLTQVGASSLDGLSFWSLLAEGILLNDGWTMHIPGDNADMTARSAQVAAMYTHFIANTSPKTQVMIGGGSGNNSTATRGATFNSSMWIPKANDLVVMFCASVDVASIATPAGWVNVLGSGIGVSTDEHTLACFYHWVTPAEETAETAVYSATVFEASVSGNTAAIVLRGIDTDTPMDAIATAYDSNDTTSPHTIPGLAGADLDTGSLVVSCISVAGTGTYAAVPVGLGLEYATSSNQSTYLAVGNSPTTSGADVPSIDIIPSVGDEYAAITIAFKAAP